MRLGLSQPDRIMAHALFCATAVLLLTGQSAAIPIGQMKTLFARGIHHVPWALAATLGVLAQQLPGTSNDLMRAISDAISHKECLARLEVYPAWQEAQAVSLDTPWPKPYVGHV
jgi:hypothetical protein